MATSALRLPTPLSRSASVAVGSTFVVAGGLDGSGKSTATVFAFDPATGRQTAAGMLAQPAHDAGAAMLGGRIVIFGGGESATIDTVQALASGRRGVLIGHLPHPRSDLTATSVGREVLIAGGFDGRALSPQVLATADGKSFRVVASLRRPVRYAAAAEAGGSLYLFGGTTGPNDERSIQRIDPAAGTVSIVGMLPVALSHASAVTIGNVIVIAGGRHHGKATTEILRFDPRTNVVSVAGHLPSPESDASAVAIGQRAYVVGGENGRSHLLVAISEIDELS